MNMMIHRSLHRHTLFLGGDRELVMYSGLGAILTVMGGFSFTAAAIALAFWLTALFWIRKWAKADPLLRPVYLRHIKQQDFYPARTSIWHRPKGASYKNMKVRK